MTPHDPARSPRCGDLVRAVVDRRSADVVEGILRIRHVPSLNYAQVLVDGEGVIVSTIEVFEPNAVPIEDLEAGDPLRNEAGWHRIVDIAQAAAEGLLQPPVERVGGSWDDLFAELARRAQPLLDAGWTLTDTSQDESWEYRDSVFYDLERNGVAIELEYYEHGQLVAYPLGQADGDEVTDPLSRSTNQPSNEPAGVHRHGMAALMSGD